VGFWRGALAVDGAGVEACWGAGARGRAGGFWLEAGDEEVVRADEQEEDGDADGGEEDVEQEGDDEEEDHQGGWEEDRDSQEEHPEGVGEDDQEDVEPERGRRERGLVSRGGGAWRTW